MVGSICVLVRKAPYGTEDAFAGLKLGLATIANGMDTRVILMDDGVFNALKDQSTGNIGMPRISDAIEDLLSLDVKIFCISEHLKVRNIQKEDLMDDLVFIHEDDVPGLSMESDCVTTF